MNRKHALSTLAAVGLAVNANVHAAEDSGVYFGIGGGEVNDKVDDFEGNGVAFKMFGGYAFNKYFAAEAAYIDAGELEDTVDGVDLTVESDGFVVAAIGKLPIGESFSLFAKAGYTFYDEKVSAQQGTLSFSEKNSDEDPLYGAGAELYLGSRFQLRAEYEVVDVSNADFNLLSISAALRF